MHFSVKVKRMGGVGSRVRKVGVVAPDGVRDRGGVSSGKTVGGKLVAHS